MMHSPYMSIFKIDTFTHSAIYLFIKAKIGIEPIYLNLQFKTLTIMLFGLFIYFLIISGIEPKTIELKVHCSTIELYNFSPTKQNRIRTYILSIMSRTFYQLNYLLNKH